MEIGDAITFGGNHLCNVWQDQIFPLFACIFKDGEIKTQVSTDGTMLITD